VNILDEICVHSSNITCEHFDEICEHSSNRIYEHFDETYANFDEACVYLIKKKIIIYV